MPFILPSALRAQVNEMGGGEELQRHVIDLLWMARDGFPDYRGEQIEFTEGHQWESDSKRYNPSIWTYESSFPIGSGSSVIRRNRSIEGATNDFGYYGHYTEDVKISGKTDFELRLEGGSTLKDSLIASIEPIIPEGWSQVEYDYPYRGNIFHWKECEGDLQGHMVRLNFRKDPHELTVGTYDDPCPGSLNLPPKTVDTGDTGAAGGKSDPAEPTVEESAILKAVAAGDMDKVLGLLLAGVTSNVSYDDGCTLLHHAVREEDIDMVKLLLDSGANINARDGDGQTSLEVAESKGYSKVAEILRTYGGENR